MELAKGLHKQEKSSGSEELLVDAYAARLQSLHEQRMDVEADALLHMVRERFPDHCGKLAAVASRTPIGKSSLERLVSPLADPSLAPERRREIETALRQRLTNPAELADCAALDPDHPLRKGAAALATALETVTSGPVRPDDILLPKISRRGPLAPWKLLVRAIAAFYDGRDEECEQQLQAIEADSAPGRFVEVMRQMLADEPEPGKLKRDQARLAEQVNGGLRSLRELFRAADSALADGARGKLVKAVREAMAECRQSAPELVQELRQRISVRTFATDCDPGRLEGAMGGGPLRNSNYWMLLARQTEDDPDTPKAIACSLWEHFRLHAVNEGWFPTYGPEAATLYLRMAANLERLMPEEVEMVRDSAIGSFEFLSMLYVDQPQSIRAVLEKAEDSGEYYYDLERLYELACQCDPTPDTFSRWLKWTRENVSGWQKSATVAEAWHEALPEDPRPLLELMELAEQRGSLRKALSYLEKAESLDRVNPEVDRARFRLLTNRVLQSLHGNKTRIATRELIELRSLRQAQNGNRSALVSALSWHCCQQAGDSKGAANELSKVSSQLDSKAASVVLFAAVGRLFGLSETECGLPETISLKPEESYSQIVARISAIGNDSGARLETPSGWQPEMIDELTKGQHKLETPELRVLTETALRDDEFELAYAASGAGLTKKGRDEARFLLLRARSLPDWEGRRWIDCLTAAAELARRNGDLDLVAEVVELRRHDRGSPFPALMNDFDQSSLSMSSRQIGQVLRLERKEHEYPVYQPPDKPFWDDEFYEDEIEDEIEDELSFDEILDSLLKKRTLPKRKKRQRKADRCPPPEQGTLF